MDAKTRRGTQPKISRKKTDFEDRNWPESYYHYSHYSKKKYVTVTYFLTNFLLVQSVPGDDWVHDRRWEFL